MSVKITIISPTRALVEGDYDEKALDEHFAFHKSKFYWRSPAVKSGRWDGKTHLFDQAARTLPIGLVRDTKKLLKEWGHKVKLIDTRPPATCTPLDYTPTLVGVQLRDYQERAIEKAVQKERGIIHGATGMGKTELAAGIIRRLAAEDARDWPVTLFLTGRKTLAWQTRERFAKRLSVPTTAIGFIQGGKWEDGVGRKRLPVYVAVVDTLKQEKCAVKRRALNNLCQLLFLDEAHHAGSTTWYSIAMRCKARYRFGLTGTPVGRSDFGDLYLRACCGGVIARVKATQLIEQGLLAKPLVYFTKIRRPKFIAGPDEPWAETYRRCIVQNESRNKIIKRYAKALQRLKKKTLILVREIQHGRALECMIPCSLFVSGKTHKTVLDQALKLFTDGDLNTLIATTIFDEGVDIPAINAMIVASGGKSMITTLQRIGRGLRPKGKDNRVFIFDFMDETNRYLYGHANRRLDICNREGFSTSVVPSPLRMADVLAGGRS